jgi:clan AA aspartic protease
MAGYIDADRLEPRLTVDIFDHRGTAIPLEAVIDTGFTGFMTLPDDLVSTPDWERTRSRTIRLADGRSRRIPAYFATVLWHGNPRTISALIVAGKPLIGMSLLWNSDIAIEAREGGRVSVTEIGNIG